MDKPLMTVKEFARYIGVGETTAYSLIKDRDFDCCFKIGRKYYINRELLDDWLKRKCR